MFRLEGYWPHQSTKYSTYKKVTVRGSTSWMYEVITHDGTGGPPAYYNILPRGRLDVPPKGKWAFEFPVGYGRDLNVNFGKRPALALLESMSTTYEGKVPVFKHVYAGVVYEG